MWVGMLQKVLGVIPLIFVFCWNSVEAEEQQRENIQVTVVAGSIGGSFYVMNAAMFDIFSKNIEGLTYSIVPGGSISNPIAINQGDAQCGFSFTNDLGSAVQGQEPYSSRLPIFGQSPMLVLRHGCMSSWMKTWGYLRWRN